MSHRPMPRPTDYEASLIARRTAAKERDHPLTRRGTRPPLATDPGRCAIIGAGLMLLVLVLAVAVVAYCRFVLGWT